MLKSMGERTPPCGTPDLNCRFVDVWSLNVVYAMHSDRVGLPLHNIHIPSPFTSIMDIFFVDLKFGHICFYTI